MVSIDPAPYLAHWRQVERQRRDILDAAVARARAAVPPVVDLLVAQGATRVWLIGSLAHARFDVNSDVDFMVSGLSEPQAFKAARMAYNLTGVTVDVIRTEDLSPDWRRYHERSGELLYG